MEYPTAARHVTIRLLAAVVLLVGSSACRSESKGGEYGGVTTDTTPAGAEMPAPGAPAAPAPGGTARLDDGNIAAILSASNREEIQPSQIAVERADDDAVKEYARRMIADHTRLEDEMTALLQQHNITLEHNAMSNQVQSETQQIIRRLENMNGSEFDRAYMEAMVNSHQKALDAINSQLLPSAQNPQLKSAIQQKVLPVVQSHLDEARKIQSSLR